MPYHVVCHDCDALEEVYEDEEKAQAQVAYHGTTGHDVEYEEVEGR